MVEEKKVLVRRLKNNPPTRVGGFKNIGWKQIEQKLQGIDTTIKKLNQDYEILQDMLAYHSDKHVIPLNGDNTSSEEKEHLEKIVEWVREFKPKYYNDFSDWRDYVDPRVKKYNAEFNKKLTKQEFIALIEKNLTPNVEVIRE